MQPTANGTEAQYVNGKITEPALNVLIVGAGIGGLTAALALRRQGHNVTVLESSKFSNETGAAIHIAPNCNGLLLRLGLDVEAVGGNEMTGVCQYGPNGDRIMEVDLRKPNEIWQHKWLLVHRAHLHTAIRKKAVEEEGDGKPVTLRLASKVVGVDAKTATVTLEDGEKVQGDLLLGADGVHSQCRAALELGDEYQPFDGGDSAFRWLVPRQELLDDPATREFVTEEGYLYMIMGDDRRLVWYPCVNNTVINFLMIHPSKETRAEGAGWNAKGDRGHLLEVGRDFADKYKTLMSKAPSDTLKVWTLLDLKVLPQWVKDRMALLGDAAHPFLPHQAQGGAQAIEDGVSLAAVLPLGTSKDDIADRLQLYQELRKARADRIQHFTRLSGRYPGELRKMGEKLDPLAFNFYNFGHDEWDHSTHALKKHLWSKQPLRYRQTTSFGPSPGPRQPQNALPDVLSHDRQWQEVHTIRFKTSRTYLQTLFPSSQFSFKSPGTVAQASFVCCSLKNMTWLGDTGYNHCGLYVHGVQYTKKNGEVLHGTFMPMLFENLTDPIITGREEIAAPKWGCDIDIHEEGSSRSIRLGWRGAVFGELDFDDLEATEPGQSAAPAVPKPVPDDGIFLYRYVPAVGEPGKADAEYAVFDPYEPAKWNGTSKIAATDDKVGAENATSNGGSSATTQKDEKSSNGNEESKFSTKKAGSVRVARKPRVKFSGRDWKSLPTIHHIAQGLADVPVYEILEAKVEVVNQVGDVRGARRIHEE